MQHDEGRVCYKDQYANTLRAYQQRHDEMKSDDRDELKHFINILRIGHLKSCALFGRHKKSFVFIFQNYLHDKFILLCNLRNLSLIYKREPQTPTS